VDQITAYHFLPSVSIEKDLKVPNMPLFTETGKHLMTEYIGHGLQPSNAASLAVTGSATLAPAAQL
jgi:hypothetical protein